MKVTVIESSPGCSGGSCPTVYKTDRGTYLVQGYILPVVDRQALPDGIPESETIVEVPAEWFFGAAQKVSA